MVIQVRIDTPFRLVSIRRTFSVWDLLLASSIGLVFRESIEEIMHRFVTFTYALVLYDVDCSQYYYVKAARHYGLNYATVCDDITSF